MSKVEYFRQKRARDKQKGALQECKDVREYEGMLGDARSGMLKDARGTQQNSTERMSKVKQIVTKHCKLTTCIETTRPQDAMYMAVIKTPTLQINNKLFAHIELEHQDL